MSDNVKNAVITIIFVSVLVITMIVNIAKKDGTISISERRKLEQFPSFSIYKLFNGKFFEKFDKYTTDQFTYRDNLRKLKVETELNIFKKKDYHKSRISAKWEIYWKSFKQGKTNSKPVFDRE